MIPLTMLPHNRKRCRQLNPAQLRLAVSWGLRVATTIATALRKHTPQRENSKLQSRGETTGESARQSSSSQSQ